MTDSIKRKSDDLDFKLFHQMIDEILDQVSSIEPYDEWQGGKLVHLTRRWGHDTDCGQNRDIHERVIEILKRYGYEP